MAALRKNLSEIDPSLIELDSEAKYLQSHSRTARRVKLQRGESWLVRFLPAALGPKRLWYARLGRHWHGQKPIFCPVHTSPDYGGDPDAFCPVCEAAALLNDDPNKVISKMGYEAQASAQWTTYCIVLQKSTGSSTVDVSEAESLMVHEFSHYKGTWEELAQFYRNNVRPNNPRSVLDYVMGCDFWVSRSAKGMRLDKQESQPIFEGLSDPAADPRIKKIEEQMRTPKVQIPTDEELRRYADTLNDDAVRAASGRGRGPGPNPEDESGSDRRRGYEPPLDSEDERPARPARPARSAPRQAAAADDDQVPGAEMPPRRAPAPAPELEPETEVEAQEELPEPAPAPVPRPAPVPLTPRAAATRPAPARASTAPASRAQPAPLPPPPPRTRTERVDDQEDLPEEARDLAPPADVPLPTSGAQAPPPVARSAPNASTAANIRNRISSVTQRQA